MVKKILLTGPLKPEKLAKISLKHFLDKVQKTIIQWNHDLGQGNIGEDWLGQNGRLL